MSSKLTRLELKEIKFKPEHAGQLGFYLAAVDDLMRKEGDNQTIGILLCKSKNRMNVTQVNISKLENQGTVSAKVLRKVKAVIEG